MISVNTNGEPLSQEFKNQIAQGNHRYLLRVDIVLTDNTVLQTITENELFQFSIEDAVSEDGDFKALGSSVVNKATLVIDNTDDIYSDHNFYKATVSLQLGLELENTQEFINEGIYTVDKANYRGNSIELVCLDSMSKFDEPYSKTSITSYPVTIQELIDDACEVCGVNLSGTIPYATDVFNVVPTDITTFREIIGYIAQITGTFAHINRLGKLYFSWFDKIALTSAINNPNLIVEGVNYINQVQLIVPNQADITITGVQAYVMNEFERFEYSAGSQDGFTLDLSGNIFLSNANAQTILDRLANDLSGLTMRGLTMKHINNPIYEAGDVGMVTYKNKNGTLLYCPFVFTRTVFSANRFQETVCAVETLLENQSTRFSSAQKVSAEASAQAEYASRMATHYLSVDDTGIMVANLATERQTPSSATGRNVFIDSDSVDIRKGQEVLASFGETTTVGREDGAHVDMSGNRLSFKVGLNEVAYVAIDEDTQESIFYMTKAIVVQDLYFGNWQWKSRANGNLALKWIGEEI